MKPDIKQLPEHVARKIRRYKNGCWMWTAAISRDNPTVRVRGRTYTAARWIYRQYHDLNSTHLVINTCGDKRCVNPDHLKSVTKSEFQKPKDDVARRQRVASLMAETLRRPWRKLSNASLGIEDFMP